MVKLHDPDHGDRAARFAPASGRNPRGLIPDAEAKASGAVARRSGSRSCSSCSMPSWSSAFASTPPAPVSLDRAPTRPAPGRVLSRRSAVKFRGGLREGAHLVPGTDKLVLTRSAAHRARRSSSRRKAPPTILATSIWPANPTFSPTTVTPKWSRLVMMVNSVAPGRRAASPTTRRRRLPRPGRLRRPYAASLVQEACHLGRLPCRSACRSVRIAATRRSRSRELVVGCQGG